MSSSEEQMPASELISLSVELVGAYVSNNSLPATDLAKLLAEIHSALKGFQEPPAPAVVEEKAMPAVPVKKSVTPDFIICLEDGKQFKSLKRHLQTKYGMTPQQYRQRWNLPADYPMVAPNYAAARSALARASGLGQMRRAEATPQEKANDKNGAVVTQPSAKPAAGKRARQAEAVSLPVAPEVSAASKAKRGSAKVATKTTKPKTTRKRPASA